MCVLAESVSVFYVLETSLVVIVHLLMWLTCSAVATWFFYVLLTNFGFSEVTVMFVLAI